MTSLMLHVDSQPVERSALAKLHVPAPTDTWHPVGHGEFTDMVEASVQDAGFKVEDMKIGLSKEEERDFCGLSRHRLFGVIETKDRILNGQGNVVIGFRNSTDKSFAASMALGSRVFVCDNRSFSGEKVLERRHTPNFLRDMPGLLNTAAEEMVYTIEFQEKLFERLEEAEVDRVADVNDMLVQSCESGVQAWSKIPVIKAHWSGPEHKVFEPRNAWSLFNAFTSVQKGYATDAMCDRTMKLTRMFHERFASDLKRDGTLN